MVRRDVQCSTSNDYDGNDGLRVLAVFAIMISSAIGTFFPLLSSRYSSIKLPNWCWFFAKFFGSGVIVATGFIHLLQPATEALGNECLGGTFAEYPWAFGICLMSLFALFLTEIVAHHYVEIAATTHKHGDQTHSHSHLNSHDHTNNNADNRASGSRDLDDTLLDDSYEMEHLVGSSDNIMVNAQGKSEFQSVQLPVSSSAEEIEIVGTRHKSEEQHQQYLNQMLSVFILEFGVIFHSVFVGLSLAVAGEEFITLFIVLIFHQMFEGLGLGTRIADTPWDETRRSTPWFLALGFTLSTPIAISIGIGVRHSFNPEGRTALIANGCFDAISAGILIYTGIVELMAHEFLYSGQFKKADGLQQMLTAYFIMCLGAGLMAVLGRWA